MTFKQFTYYQRVCETGNITTAAEQLFVTRSAVSKAITELEEEFEAPLFVRSKTGVTPTPAGEELLRMASFFESSYQSLRTEIKNLHAASTNTLKFAASPTGVRALCQELLVPFHELYPDSRFCMHEYFAEECFRRLEFGEYDFVVTSCPYDHQKYEALSLYRNGFSLVVPTDDDHDFPEQISFQDLSGLPLGFSNAKSPIEDRIKDSLASPGRRYNVLIKTSDLDMLILLMREHLVYPILPDDMARDLKDVRVYKIERYTKLTNNLIWNRGKPLSAQAEIFVRFAESKFK